jgi:hypothetical protein
MFLHYSSNGVTFLIMWERGMNNMQGPYIDTQFQISSRLTQFEDIYTPPLQ